MSQKPYVNVPLGKQEAKRYQDQEAFWTGPRLVALTAGVLLVSLVFLYTIAQTTSETTWSSWEWLVPG